MKNLLIYTLFCFGIGLISACTKKTTEVQHDKSEKMEVPMTAMDSVDMLLKSNQEKSDSMKKVLGIEN